MEKIITHEITITQSFGNITRQRYALLVLTDGQGHYILSGKPMYPVGTYRFFGGGVDQGETALDGAQRELQEETGITDAVFEPLLTITTKATDAEGKKYTLESAIFLVTIGNQPIQLGDDVTKIITTDVEGIKQAAENFQRMPHEKFFYPGSGDYYYLDDYGKLFGFIMERTYSVLRSRSV